MSHSGLQAVSNASEMFLSEQDLDSDVLAGLAVAVIMDGSRTFLIEIQVTFLLYFCFFQYLKMSSLVWVSYYTGMFFYERHHYYHPCYRYYIDHDSLQVVRHSKKIMIS